MCARIYIRQSLISEKKRSGTVVRLGKDGDTQVRTERIVKPVRKLEHEAESSIEKKISNCIALYKRLRKETKIQQWEIQSAITNDRSNPG